LNNLKINTLTNDYLTALNENRNVASIYLHIQRNSKLVYVANRRSKQLNRRRKLIIRDNKCLINRLNYTNRAIQLYILILDTDKVL